MRSASVRTKRWIHNLLTAALILNLTGPCAASAPLKSRPEELSGHTSVIDGDTIVIDGVHVRLWGIDAPESKQLCADGWPAGTEAKRALEALMDERDIACEDRGHDRYGRTIGLCRANGADIQAAMVSAGMAWAFVRYSHDYVHQEEQAKAAGLGIHAHACQPAWVWRAQQQP